MSLLSLNDRFICLLYLLVDRFMVSKTKGVGLCLQLFTRLLAGFISGKKINPEDDGYFSENVSLGDIACDCEVL